MKGGKAENPRPKSTLSNERTPKKRKDSVSSKYSYDLKKQVNKQNEKLVKGGKFGPFNDFSTSRFSLKFTKFCVDKSGLEKPVKVAKNTPTRVQKLSKNLKTDSDEYEEESSESADLPRNFTHTSVKDKVQNLNRMNQNVIGRK